MSMFDNKKLYGVRGISVVEKTMLINSTIYSGKLPYPEVVHYPPYLSTVNGDFFENASGVKKIILPDTVTTLQGSTFEDCHDLEEVHIGSGVRSLSKDNLIYSRKGKLGRIIISPNNNYYKSTDDGKMILTKDGSTLVAFFETNGDTTPTISDGITTIRERAFNQCNTLTSIMLPSTLIEIGTYAFYNCSSLTNLAIPQGVMSLGMYMVWGCTSLRSITIPNSVTNLSAYQFFYYCPNLQYIYTNIGNGARLRSMLSNANIPAQCQIVEQ